MSSVAGRGEGMRKTLQLAKEREAHWLKCKELLGMVEEHDYDYRILLEEAVKEAADLFNYLEHAGYHDLAEDALILGEKIVARMG